MKTKIYKILLSIFLWTISVQLYSQGLILTSGAYDVHGLTYDKNGNINTLKRQGLINGTVSSLDELYYTYTGDQLKVVKDLGSSDIFNDRVSALEEFMYDANGNMVKDLNKEIDTIYYNILNLPDTVVFIDGRKVVYTYLSNGAKIKQKVLDSSGKTVKLKRYSGIAEYFDNDVIIGITSISKLSFNKEEDQVIRSEYRYFLQDHVGNNRMVITPDTKVDTFATDYEGATDNDFANYGEVTRVNSTLYNHTSGGSYSERLSGVDGETIGLAKSLAVFPGDTVKMEVYAKYFANQGGSTGIASNMLAAITAAFGITPDPGGEGEWVYETFEALFGAGPLVDNSTNNGDAPAAYLNYLYFDKEYNLLDMGYDRISTVDLGDDLTSAHERLHLQAVVTQPGYLYIYLSNENNYIQDVYFDDLKIMHKKSPIQQETHYYPFGEAIASLSYTREGVKNDYLYNGKELDSTTQWHDYGARHYDAQLARWHNIDPLAEKYSSWSPYSYALSDPINIIDPDGRDNQSALDWSSENLLPRVDITYKPWYADPDNSRRWEAGVVPDHMVCQEAVFTAYMNSDAGPWLRENGFANGRDNTAFKNRNSAREWFQEGDGTYKEYDTDITSGQVGDIVETGEDQGYKGHVTLLAAAPPEAISYRRGGTEHERIDIKTHSTGATQTDENGNQVRKVYGEKTFTMVRKRNADGSWTEWRVGTSDGRYKENGQRWRGYMRINGEKIKSEEEKKKQEESDKKRREEFTNQLLESGAPLPRLLSPHMN
ncbi:hypothetical protein C900_05903 [Fulvivirga imtechensis AK7]|uniref:Uncharacterized protein n=1 Tax=Fulvivirga imtechensis AK7 TaxID=1237149 RepID=L8JIS7_9BACT|nr:RHS repeat-associated core domain-containing protein [Fulvivirga imtechensis]ELR68720.1 hypothetical protein C900_05903 [Fulvivirga imtechensis AK7]